MNNICTLLAGAALLLSCSSAKTSPSTGTALPDKASTTLVTHSGTVVNAEPRLSDMDTWTLCYMKAKRVHYEKGQPVATLHFNPEANTVSGFSGVNHFSAGYSIILPVQDGKEQHELGTLSIGDIITTKVAGPDDYMTLERTFISLLAKVNAFHVTEYDLELLQDDKVILKLEKQR